MPGAFVCLVACEAGGPLDTPQMSRVLHALSLPGRVAPLSAARAIHDTVCAVLQEEGVL